MARMRLSPQKTQRMLQKRKKKQWHTPLLPSPSYFFTVNAIEEN